MGTQMRHAFVDIGDKTMCSRCGNEVLRVDEECPSISDGEMYKRHPNHPDSCASCGGLGYFSAMGCCGHATPSGECCGNGIEVQEPCEHCQTTGIEPIQPQT